MFLEASLSQWCLFPSERKERKTTRHTYSVFSFLLFFLKKISTPDRAKFRGSKVQSVKCRVIFLFFFCFISKRDFFPGINQFPPPNSLISTLNGSHKNERFQIPPSIFLPSGFHRRWRTPLPLYATSWGSARDALSFARHCSITFSLPLSIICQSLFPPHF